MGEISRKIVNSLLATHLQFESAFFRKIFIFNVTGQRSST